MLIPLGILILPISFVFPVVLPGDTVTPTANYACVSFVAAMNYVEYQAPGSAYQDPNCPGLYSGTYTPGSQSTPSCPPICVASSTTTYQQVSAGSTTQITTQLPPTTTTSTTTTAQTTQSTSTSTSSATTLYCNGTPYNPATSVCNVNRTTSSSISTNSTPNYTTTTGMVTVTSTLGANTVTSTVVVTTTLVGKPSFSLPFPWNIVLNIGTDIGAIVVIIGLVLWRRDS